MFGSVEEKSGFAGFTVACVSLKCREIYLQRYHLHDISISSTLNRMYYLLRLEALIYQREGIRTTNPKTRNISISHDSLNRTATYVALGTTSTSSLS